MRRTEKRPVVEDLRSSSISEADNRYSVSNAPDSISSSSLSHSLLLKITPDHPHYQQVKHISDKTDIDELKANYISYFLDTADYEEKIDIIREKKKEIEAKDAAHKAALAEKDSKIKHIEDLVTQLASIILSKEEIRKLQDLDQEKKDQALIEHFASFKKSFDETQAELVKKKVELSEVNASLLKPLPPSEDKHQDDYYEGIIKINSIKGLEEGWDIVYRDHLMYKERIKRNTVVVAVVGNYNKGKTWLLNKLCNAGGLPQGFSVSTEGVSFTYTTDINKKEKTQTLAIDSKGGSLPVEIRDILSKHPDDEETLLEDNEFQQKFKERLTDHLSTEDLLQNFVTDVSTVNLIVVSDITFEDQRLINRLKRKFTESSSSLIVIHNLYHCTTQKEVEETHIKKRIMPSFNLKSLNYTFNVENGNNKYYEEMLNEDKRIIHFIFAREGTEAGDYYNRTSLEFLTYQLNIMQQKKCDIVKEFHKHLTEKLNYYIQMDLKKPNVEIIPVDEGKGTQRIRCADIKDKKLKSISADESGMLQTNSCLYTSYAIRGLAYDKDAKKDIEIDNDDEGLLFIKIECPDGTIDGMSIKSRPEIISDEFKINVQGKKMKVIPQNAKFVHDLRKDGEFKFSTPLFRRQDFGKLEHVSNDYKDGCFIIRYRFYPDDEWN